MSARVAHFEIPFDDQQRAERFYREAFEWSMSPMDGLDYVSATTGPSDDGPPSEPGFINGGLLPRRQPVLAPALTLQVDDLDAVLSKVESSGGSTVAAKQAVGDLGFSAYVTDTEGNLLGLWQNA